MQILKFPDPNLFKVCNKVNVFGAELVTLLDAMWETMKAHNGLGLAANQVGLDFRMFVMQGTHGRVNLVNPVITARSILAASLREGCLSAPGDFVTIPSRATWVQVKYQDEKGNEECDVFTDLYAVCVQHEIDHLNGKGFMEDKSIPKSKRRELAKKWGFKL